MLGPMQLRVDEIRWFGVQAVSSRWSRKSARQYRPSRGHTLRVRKVRHGNEAHRQGRSVAGSQPGALRTSLCAWLRRGVAACLLAWYGAGPLRARGCFTFLQSRLSAVEFLDGSRPRRRFRRCCDISWLSAAELRSYLRLGKALRPNPDGTRLGVGCCAASRDWQCAENHVPRHM